MRSLIGGSEHLLSTGAGLVLASENICELSKDDMVDWREFRRWHNDGEG